MSTIWVFIALLLVLAAAPSRAHEIRPAIADVTVSGDQVDIEIFVTLEALVAQLDLANLVDTNQSPLAARYDDLRAMEPASLEQAFTDAWPVIAPGFRLKAGAAVLPDGVDGSISTLPVTYGKKLPDAAIDNLLMAAAAARSIRDRTGTRIQLALEPEPGALHYRELFALLIDLYF